MSETSSNKPALTYGFIRLAAYQLRTSGASADKKLRICVLYASRSIILVVMFSAGLADWNFAINASMVARGAGFDVSRLIFRLPVNSADAGPASATSVASDTAVAFKMERMVSSLVFPRFLFQIMKLGFTYWYFNRDSHMLVNKFVGVGVRKSPWPRVDFQMKWIGQILGLIL